MTRGQTLTVLIPLVVLGYAVWLILRMIQNRKRGKCGCGCANCPMREGCQIAGKLSPPTKEDE